MCGLSGRSAAQRQCDRSRSRREKPHRVAQLVDLPELLNVFVVLGQLAVARDDRRFDLRRQALLLERLGKVGRGDRFDERAKLLAEVVAGFLGHFGRQVVDAVEQDAVVGRVRNLVEECTAIGETFLGRRRIKKQEWLLDAGEAPRKLNRSLEIG